MINASTTITNLGKHISLAASVTMCPSQITRQWGRPEASLASAQDHGAGAPQAPAEGKGETICSIKQDSCHISSTVTQPVQNYRTWDNFQCCIQILAKLDKTGLPALAWSHCQLQNAISCFTKPLSHAWSSSRSLKNSSHKCKCCQCCWNLEWLFVPVATNDSPHQTVTNTARQKTITASSTGIAKIPILVFKNKQHRPLPTIKTQELNF